MRLPDTTRPLFLAAIFLGFLAVKATATTYYVDVNSTNPTPPYTSWSTASTDIQSAVDETSNGDFVLVNPGVYQTGGETVSATPTTNRVAITQAITLESVNGPAVTMIEGYQVPLTINSNNAVRCVYVTNNAALIGFTLTNGATKTFDLGGGGVFCQSSACIVSNCVIVGNSAFSDGGGAYLGTLLDCTLSDNSIISSQYPQAGGGAYESHLADCIVVSNFAYPSGSSGGGTYNCHLTNCVVADNLANGGSGGGVCFGSALNCTITGNSAYEGGGAASANMTNCIVYYNYTPSSPSIYETNYAGVPPAYSCTTPAGGTGNITNAPLLVGISEIASNSPCRGAGAAVASGVDINGNPWANPPSIGCEEPYPGSMFGNLNVSINAPWTNDPVGYPLTLQANISGPAYNSVWNFGDGTMVTNIPYVSHTWPALGVYPVTLTAYNDSYPTGQTAILLVNVYQPTNFYVISANPFPTAPYDSWAKAATNIQTAINAAIPGGIVVVSNGVYNVGSTKSSDGGTNRVAITQPLTVQSVNGPAVTIIDGTATLRCAYLTNSAALIGFTLTNANSGNSGVVYCTSTNSLVANCLFTKNHGLIAADSGTVSNCTIIGNFTYGSEYSTLFNCLISSNQYWGAQSAILNNCLISANSEGGATYSTLNNCVVSNNFNWGIYESSAINCLLVSNNSFGDMNETIAADVCELTNCLIAKNYNGVWYSSAVNCTIVNNSLVGVASGSQQNCIIYYNYINNQGGSSTNCCTFPLPSSGFGNFTNPPLFINLTNDFQLQSNSPCINSGNNAYILSPTDFDGNPRIVGGTVDIGAYEYQTPTSVISYAYLQQYGLPTDGSVDYADLDGTPYTVYQDWIAGLNPTNPASVLVLLSPTTTTNVSGITVSWESTSGIDYNLLRATNLTSVFTTIQSNIVGQAGTTSYPDTTATNGGPYFYRVAVP